VNAQLVDFVNEPVPELLGEELQANDEPDILLRARQRSCKPNGQGCVQIKVQQFSCDGDMRRGCITQFSPEEIVAIQMSVHDMDRGESHSLTKQYIEQIVWWMLENIV
jgi:hypothetical protein